MNSIEWFFSTILVGFLAFVATNIDDLLLLVLLFSLTNLRKRHIVIGQYLGFIVILVISSLGSFIKWIVPLEGIGSLGLVPFVLGIRELWKLLWGKKLIYERLYLPPDTSSSFVRMVFEFLLNPKVYSVAALTVGNGSDNVATYVPLFAAGDITHIGVLIVFFLLLVGLWCYIGHALVSFPTVAGITEKCGHILLPFIFIVLGILIMRETGFVGLILHW